MAYTTAGFGATINGKHTLRDYGLSISNTNIVAEPTPKTNYVDIPGSSYRLDLLEALTGRVEYNSRTLTFSLGGFMGADKWSAFYRDLLNTYQGKEVKVVLDQEPEYYYQGRATLSDFTRSQQLGTFTLTVDADAYKYDITSSDEDWLWDSFNFETGIIREYTEIAVSGSTSKFIDGSEIPVVPVFYVSDLSTDSSAYISYSGKKCNCSDYGSNDWACGNQTERDPHHGYRRYRYGKEALAVEFKRTGLFQHGLQRNLRNGDHDGWKDCRKIHRRQKHLCRFLYRRGAADGMERHHGLYPAKKRRASSLQYLGSTGIEVQL